MRYETVQDQSGKERPQNAFHPDKFHQSCSKKYHGKNENKLHHVVVIFTEEPTTNTRKEENDQET